MFSQHSAYPQFFHRLAGGCEELPGGGEHDARLLRVQALHRYGHDVITQLHVQPDGDDSVAVGGLNQDGAGAVLEKLQGETAYT